MELIYSSCRFEIIFCLWLDYGATSLKLRLLAISAKKFIKEVRNCILINIQNHLPTVGVEINISWAEFNSSWSSLLFKLDVLTES